jgi:hypothetical protein
MNRRRFCQSAILLPGAFAIAPKFGAAADAATLKKAQARELRREFFNKKQIHDLWFEIEPGDWKRLRAGYFENDYYP